MPKKETKFPTLGVILLVVAILWLIDDMTIIDIRISWFPLIILIVSIGMIVNRYSKE